MIFLILYLFAQGPWIVFVANDTSDASSETDVFLWKCPGTPDACEPINLTRTPGYSEYHPGWKPDVSSIIFFAAPNPPAQDTHRLWMAWPNGGNWANPYPMTIDSVRNSRPLITMGEFHGGATWYPDAETIAFYRRSQVGDVFIFKHWDAGSGMGSGFIQLTTDYEGFRGPDVRPGDHRFVYPRQPGMNYFETEVYTVNPDGSGISQLTSDTDMGFNDEPAWSPPGSKIVYVSTPDGNDNAKEIWTMSADGSSKTRLTNNTFSENHPVWFQDSIYFSRYISGESDIWIMDTLGNNQHPISDTSDGWSISDFDVIWGNDCLSLEEKDKSAETSLKCSPIPFGILFISPEPMPIRVYRADGRLVYAGELKKGENRISLGQGVYMWRAGDHGEFKGKAVVR